MFNDKGLIDRLDQANASMLKLSDDIGKMSNRIGDMADRIGDMSERIITTQEMQSNNMEKTQQSLLDMMAANNKLVALLVEKKSD